MNILLRELEVENIHQFDVYRKHGGFDGLQKALVMKPAEVIDVVKASNLRGRGGAGFPTGIKWSFIPQSEPVKYLVINADESEPGTFKDRQIMENNPYQLLEGSLIGAYAIQAAAVYIYLRGEYWEVAAQLDRCIEKMRAEGIIGQNIMGSGYSVEMYTHLGAGAYICGEESALLNSLEGVLGQPRVRPPFPANKGGGLYKEPTVVNNVETIANVPWIMVNGADAYKAIGTEKSSGTKVFCLSGDIAKPGNYELPLGTTVRDLLEGHGGGVRGADQGRRFKALLPSGASGPIIPITDAVLDTPMTYEAFAALGTVLGSASFILLDDTRDIVWAASKMTKFFKHESCGKCTPCREGTYWLDKVLDRLIEGKATIHDLDNVQDIASNIVGMTLCALGDFAANPVLATMKNFRSEFEAYATQKAISPVAPIGDAKESPSAGKRRAEAVGD
ncbi:MAG: NADH-quinone oxidoreductase subunit NuoF [Phototrophicaceae bacterium]|jgi:NADH-quinone oxidoreductase subunit F